MKNIALIAACAAIIPLNAFAQSPATPAPTLAPSATAAPSSMTPDRGKFRAACGADIAKYCGDSSVAANTTPTKEQRTKVRACLTTHTAELSTDCKAAVIERETESKAKKS